MEIIHKTWGYEKWIVNKPEYCGKLLFFRAGEKCSFHYHKIKDETFYLHSGKIRLLYSNDDDITKAQSTILLPEVTFHVPVGLRHQIIAFNDSELFEFSTQHFDEDSIRICR